MALARPRPHLAPVPAAENLSRFEQHRRATGERCTLELASELAKRASELAAKASSLMATGSALPERREALSKDWLPALRESHSLVGEILGEMEG